MTGEIFEDRPGEPDPQRPFAKPAAEVVKDLGILPFNMEPDDFIVGAIVICKTLDSRGNAGVYARWSEDLTWIDRLGLADAFHTLAALEIPGARGV